MKKIGVIAVVVFLFAACKPKVEEAIASTETTMDSVVAIVDSIPPAPVRSGKLAATATDVVVGKDGKTIVFTYDNNASTVSFEWYSKEVVLTSKEKISDMPNANGRTYSNDEFTYNNKNGIKITDKTGKIVFEEKQ